MPNSLTILGEHFTSQSSAKEFFEKIRQALMASSAVLSEGRDFELLRDLYVSYCKATNWDYPGPPVGFVVKNTARGSGPNGGTTQCFYVTFADGTETPFSAPKAIQAVAQAKDAK
ncbi:hypothetical protein HNP46_006322 [Pseudomonas nitritireducens]|uniref:DUF3223 domain-containing protein n=1 Tax=Pseudomonas nitroreducens TaxID=46680 RepID=A0A7W7P4Z5_PSENT|nr:hypothetical protein [Pseudomonas nitritireducens]MBB4867409.1 hypothetical protein [Pseudomonas nitritireducens]